MILTTIIGLTALSVFGGDAIYSLCTGRSERNWEATIQRGADGVRRGAEAYAVGEGRTAILFVHGFGSSPAMFTRMTGELAARGYACRAMRLPGFCEPSQDFASYTRADWLKGIQGELDALRAQHEHVWLVGHSLGGALSLELLRRNPAGADGLILMAPLIAVSSRRSLGIEPGKLFRLGDHVLPFSRTFKICFPIDMKDPSVATIEHRDLFVPRATYRELFALIREARENPGSLELPVELFVAPQDRVVDSVAAEEFVRRVAPQAKIVYAERSGHVIPLDYGWTEAVESIDQFIVGHER